MSVTGGLLEVLLIVLYFGVIVFLITLLWRIIIALEKTARHLLEIAQDVKELSLRFPDERK